MKKSILFVIDSLDIAGAEKSLVTLLSMLDYSRYSVDLQLFSHGHALEELVPEEVNILEPLKYTNFTKQNVKDSIKYAIGEREYMMLYSRLKYSIGIRRKEYTNPQKAMIFWQSVSKVIENNPKTYDIAVSYAQGIPTFYVAEKIKANNKFAWVNTSLIISEMERDYQTKFYDKYNKIIAVSYSAKEKYLDIFPFYSDKIKVIFDINNPILINKMSQIGKDYEDNYNGIRILTIGRLSEGKGYDIALEACKRLKEKGINFKWYVLGKGPLKEEIEDFIIVHDLAEHFILLGVKTNPYPFIKDADIYVQTSRFEGFGLAIAEARMLNIPVVTTRFDAVFNQMIHEKNGLVVDMNADAVSDGILRLINDQELRQSIVNYLHSEKKGNTEEIEKVYQLLG
ncbi:glycosyl transferase [Oceanobacillus arenosus]|uniref:Glycosyl transferase n=1 Tax=Oceanobacillus arenosus TaxID=1229153 RepID=A0A3D8Q1U2_9BACI|nr:glycosyltransferase [Oceanobacillus arenosus]RDW22400.1 glycosyl transferase [Oceanobacillus arenosus]